MFGKTSGPGVSCVPPAVGSTSLLVSASLGLGNIRGKIVVKVVETKRHFFLTRGQEEAQGHPVAREWPGGTL
jgi:hypothetical protein